MKVNKIRVAAGVLLLSCVLLAVYGFVNAFADGRKMFLVVDKEESPFMVGNKIIQGPYQIEYPSSPVRLNSDVEVKILGPDRKTDLHKVTPTKTNFYVQFNASDQERLAVLWDATQDLSQDTAVGIPIYKMSNIPTTEPSPSPETTVPTPTTEPTTTPTTMTPVPTTTPTPEPTPTGEPTAPAPTATPTDEITSTPTVIPTKSSSTLPQTGSEGRVPMSTVLASLVALVFVLAWLVERVKRG